MRHARWRHHSHRPVRRQRIIYADMRPRELSPGVWAVVETDYERVVISGFATNAAAWQWLDANTYDGRRARDAHRIRMAFAGERYDAGLA